MGRGPKPLGKLESIAEILPAELTKLERLKAQARQPDPPDRFDEHRAVVADLMAEKPAPRPRKFICYLCPRVGPFWTREAFLEHLDKGHRT